MNRFPLYLTTPECEMKVLYFCFTAEGAIQLIEKKQNWTTTTAILLHQIHFECETL